MRVGKNTTTTDLRAAAERIVNAPRVWTGPIPAGPGAVDINVEDAVRVAAAYLVAKVAAVESESGGEAMSDELPHDFTNWWPCACVMRNEHGDLESIKLHKPTNRKCHACGASRPPKGWNDEEKKEKP